jgi:hypothetical protein
MCGTHDNFFLLEEMGERARVARQQELIAQWSQFMKDQWRVAANDTPSPVVTFHQEPVAWLNSPILVDPHQLAHARARAQAQYHQFIGGS